MATGTVRDLSAAGTRPLSTNLAFARHCPRPGVSSGLTIAPLATAAEVAAEGRAMHHCATSYIPEVASGDAYLFSACQGDKRIATFGVEPTRDRIGIAQMRGLCNALLCGNLERLRRWAGHRATGGYHSPPAFLAGSCCRRTHPSATMEMP